MNKAQKIAFYYLSVEKGTSTLTKPKSKTKLVDVLNIASPLLSKFGLGPPVAGGRWRQKKAA